MYWRITVKYVHVLKSKRCVLFVKIQVPLSGFSTGFYMIHVFAMPVMWIGVFRIIL